MLGIVLLTTPSGSSYKIGGSKIDPTLKVSSNVEVHFAFFNAPIVYISRGGCF